MASLFLSFMLSASFLPLPPANNPHAPLPFRPDWTPGFVVLETNDTVACSLRYNQLVPEGLLQVADGEKILTLSVKDVKCFFFFDQSKNRYRKFFTLSVPIPDHVNREMFLEYVYGNENVSILIHKTMDKPHGYRELSIFGQPFPVNNQYLLDCRTGRLLRLSEANALSLTVKTDAVKEYVDENEIRFRKISDYVKVFEFDRSL